MEMWQTKYGITRVNVKPWKTQTTRYGEVIQLYRDDLGATYSSRKLKSWDELTPQQKARAYRDAYEANRNDALWQVAKDPTLGEQYPKWIEQLKKERDEGIAAIERGESVNSPRHVWE